MEAFYCVEWEKLLYECAAASSCCAIAFYQREGGEIQGEGLDDAAGEKFYGYGSLNCINFVLYYPICFFDAVERRGKRKCCESLEFARNR